MKFKSYLEKIGACSKAIEWVGNKTRKQAWNECQRSDWMLWYLRNTQILPKEIWVRLAIEFAKESLHLIPNGKNHHAIKAIESAETWLANPCEETQQAAARAWAADADAAWAADADAAWAAARAAAWAADAAAAWAAARARAAAWAAAADAAWAAARAAAAASDAASDAAWAAAWAAAAASDAASDADSDAAWAAARASQAETTRKYVKFKDLN